MPSTVLAPVPEKERLPNKGPNQYKLVLTSKPDAPEGLVGGYVKVQTGSKKQPEMDLAISGYIKPTISITPLSVNFGNFDPKGDAVKRTTHASGATLAVERIGNRERVRIQLDDRSQRRTAAIECLNPREV